MLLDETQWSDHLCKNWEKAVIIFLPWPCMLIACEAKASEVISSLEWVRYECTGEHSSLRHSTVPSFHSILETRSLPAEENVMLLAVTNQLQKMEDYSIYSLSVLFTFNPLCLEFKKQKKTKKPTRKDHPSLFYISHEETKLLLHAHGCQVPSFQSWERCSITRRTYLCDSVGSHGSVLLLYPGLYRLQIAGPGCWCNMDHQKDLFCRLTSITSHLSLSSVIFQHKDLQLVYNLHRCLFISKLKLKITAKKWNMNVVALVYPMKVIQKENKNWQINCFFLWHNVGHSELEWNFQRCCTLVQFCFS